MGHKTHPLGFRLGITQENRSFWYSKLKDYSKIIQEDYAIREIVLKSLSDKSIKHTGISKIIINRNSAQDQV